MKKSPLKFIIIFFLTAQNKMTFYDFSRVQNFNGMEDGFDDSTHSSYQNMDLIVQKTFGAWPKLPPPTS